MDNYGNSVGAWNRLKSDQMNFLPPARYNRPSKGINKIDDFLREDF